VFGQVLNPSAQPSRQYGSLNVVPGLDRNTTTPGGVVSELTALLTFFNDTTTERVINNGPVRVLDRTGTGAIYFGSGSSDFTNLNSFKNETPVQNFTLRHQVDRHLDRLLHHRLRDYGHIRRPPVSTAWTATNFAKRRDKMKPRFIAWFGPHVSPARHLPRARLTCPQKNSRRLQFSHPFPALFIGLGLPDPTKTVGGLLNHDAAGAATAPSYGKALKQRMILHSQLQRLDRQVRTFTSLARPPGEPLRTPRPLSCSPMAKYRRRGRHTNGG
jgi:hypothetical protein